MEPFDPEELSRAVAGEGGQLLDPASDRAARLLESWKPVLSGRDPGSRRAAALATWNRDLRELIPEFSAALDSRLADVRVIALPAGTALLYMLRSESGGLESWAGQDPRDYVDPIFVEAFPAPILAFLKEVHAGFAQDGTRFGLMPPDRMVTLAQSVGMPLGFPDFDELHDVSSTRLVWVSENQSILQYLLSPDLPPGHSALLYEGDLDIGDAGQQLDRLMMIALQR